MQEKKTMSGITKNAVPVPETSFPEPTTKNDVPRCTLTDAELLEKCHEWITKLCNTGGRAWVMHVPARLNEDPDLLFAELTWRFKKLLRAGSQITKNDDTAVKLFTKEDLRKAWLHGELRVPEELRHCNNFEVYFKNIICSGSGTKNDDTAGDFSQAEISTLIAKVHDDMEGRYNLTGEDLFNIHAALCKLQ